ncbi:MAG: hypothetical protein M3218_00420 [Thermoproteota archaeon]|jgi:hypothetical protein|nr:hypothetical protein [Thermoproteota archaeon]MDQ3961945.1 hypothetical protein [Thermoproteota archaeon]
MASNIDKVEEKVKEDVKEAIKTSKTRHEMERKLDPNDVSYRIKDETKEGKKQPYRPNQ